MLSPSKDLASVYGLFSYITESDLRKPCCLIESTYSKCSDKMTKEGPPSY